MLAMAAGLSANTSRYQPEVSRLIPRAPSRVLPGIIAMTVEARNAKKTVTQSLAASGAALGSGSSVDVMEVLDARLETQIQDSSRAAHMEAQALRQGASMSRYSGKQQASALKLQAFGTLLDGASAGFEKNMAYKANKKTS